MAKAKAQSTQIVKRSVAPADLAKMEPWELELAQEAKAEVAKEVAGMPRLGHSNAGLDIDGKKVEGNKIKIGIVDYIFSKHYFAEKYVPGKAGTPACYAYGREEAGMVPHPNAPDKQSATCADCKHNVFGTAEQGRGKRCSDVRKVGVIVEVTDPESIAQAEVRSLSIPPGSLKNWGKYLRMIPDVTPTGNVRAVLTEVSTEPNGGAYALTFRAVDRLAPEFVKAIMGKRERVVADLMQPWPTLESAAEKTPAPRKKIKGQ